MTTTEETPMTDQTPASRGALVAAFKTGWLAAQGLAVLEDLTHKDRSELDVEAHAFARRADDARVAALGDDFEDPEDDQLLSGMQAEVVAARTRIADVLRSSAFRIERITISDPDLTLGRDESAVADQVLREIANMIPNLDVTALTSTAAASVARRAVLDTLGES